MKKNILLTASMICLMVKGVSFEPDPDLLPRLTEYITKKMENLDTVIINDFLNTLKVCNVIDENDSENLIGQTLNGKYDAISNHLSKNWQKLINLECIYKVMGKLQEMGITRIGKINL